MKYNKTVNATFIERPNRFVAKVSLGGEEIFCHVKNTGRCRELLRPGADVWLEDSENPNRKYRYSLVSVRKGERMVNMDSQAPNKAVGEWLRKGGLFKDIKLLKPESRYGSSRFDFYCEYEDKKAFIEVKGVTLENDNIVSFPDAPTERGARHVAELIECIKDGYEAYIIFVVQMKNVLYFTPNEDHDPAFAAVLRKARQEGVNIIAADCFVSDSEMIIEDLVEVKL
ncbi:MAG: DNA/RNA nuclease SfsA [Clostridia bacterium]|nr:DNA/RNA nuclease SfsA [Clostridia bacterium]